MNVFGLLCIATTFLPTPAAKMSIFIGTYTSPTGSRGIYRSALDPKTGELGAVELVAEVSNPSFVALSPDSKFLYAVDESSEGKVNAYAVAEEGGLTFLNSSEGKGAGPCHVSVDPTGKSLFTASYGGGTVAAFTLKNGSLSKSGSVFENAGSGPDATRQSGPHMHSVYADRNSKFIYACDLGTDEILRFQMTPEGELKRAEPRGDKTVPGGGPRHLAFSPDGQFAYVNNEMLNSVSAFAVDPKNGALRLSQTLSTLPESPTPIRNSTAEIHIHPSGKWLFVSNRGHDSIATYALAKNGTMKLVAVTPLGVQEPRGFDVDPTGHWLIVAGQNSNELASLRFDPKTGAINPATSRVKVDRPVCVVIRRN